MISATRNGRTPEDAARHPIRVVATRTGLSPSVLRAWERRYGVVDPARSDGGQRLYSDADIDWLSLLKRVTDAGRAIGDVAELAEEEVRRLAAEDEEARRAVARREGNAPPDGDEALAEEIRSRAWSAIEELDAEGLERSLRRGAAALGGVAFMERVVAPVLRRVGDSWAGGRLRPAHEHIATAVVRRVLTWLSDPTSAVSGPSIVVGTLAGDRHDLGAMLAATTASLEGWAVTFLGSDLPAEEIAGAATGVGAQLVGLGIADPDDPEGSRSALRTLRSILPAEVGIVVGGGGADSVLGDETPLGVRPVESLFEFQQLLRAADDGEESAG